jgi:hypothetical protein
MAKRANLPGDRIVATITSGGSLDMASMFTCRCRAVMAAGTTAGYVGVIETNAFPAAG